MITDPQLGQRVTFTRPLTRVVVPGKGQDGRHAYDDRKEWQPVVYDTATHEGTVIGVRTLSNGQRRWGGYDDPTTYRATEHFPVVVIAEGLRTRPVYVLHCDVEPIPDQPDLFAEKVVALEKIAAALGSDPEWEDPAAHLEDAAQYISAAGMPDPGSQDPDIVAHYRAEADRLGVS